ncbi:type II toxin-antitoxin system ParD family antitoxin [Mesorhizobium sp. M0488]|uniref:type II toxin-antitoxin system ParD family antitoxin n=1 Tax=unclassified Mesorhizobium TaxID=325217 RepID=UPI003339F84C
MPNHALNDHYESFIRKQLESGCYNNASEIVRIGPSMLEDSRPSGRMTARGNAGAFDRAPAGSNERCSGRDGPSRPQARHRAKQAKAS